jgi:hypothetical protein
MSNKLVFYSTFFGKGRKEEWKGRWNEGREVVGRKEEKEVGRKEEKEVGRKEEK